MRAYSSLFLNAVVVSLLLCLSCGPRLRPTALPPLLPAEVFAETEVVPHTEGAIKPGRNYVYCPTFQMAWDELCDRVIKSPLQLSGDPPLAQILNGTELPGLGLEGSSFFAKAGLVKDGVLTEIRSDLSSRFPNSKIQLPEASGDSMVAFAYLEKSLPFAEKFDRLRKPILFQNDEGTTRVRGFGFSEDMPLGHVRGTKLCAQIRVIHYAGQHEFLIELIPSAPGDRIILAKMPRPATIGEALQSVEERYAHKIEDWLSQVQKNETVAVPIISVGVARRYGELEQLAILNSPWKEHDYELTLAEQCIQFRLDEYGASLASNSAIAAKSASVPDVREFIFDKPFLVCLQRKNSAVPYLAIWVETTELLEKQ